MELNFLGDLTDAKFRDLRGSKQFVDEWEKYHDVMQKCKEKVKTWLDLRGNHGKINSAVKQLWWKFVDNLEIIFCISS